MYHQRRELNPNSQKKVRHSLVSLRQLSLKKEPNINL